MASVVKHTFRVPFETLSTPEYSIFCVDFEKSSHFARPTLYRVRFADRTINNSDFHKTIPTNGNNQSGDFESKQSQFGCFRAIAGAENGEVSERFKELVLKTSVPSGYRGFESLPLRSKLISFGSLLGLT